MFVEVGGMGMAEMGRGHRGLTYYEILYAGTCWFIRHLLCCRLIFFLFLIIYSPTVSFFFREYILDRLCRAVVSLVE